MPTARPASAATPQASGHSHLLTTKLYLPPPRPHLVARLRLLERLSQGHTGRLVLISGPAGFGKTTLLSEWAQKACPHIAWLSLDQADNDPARFWTYAIAALQTIREGLGAAALDQVRRDERQPLIRAFFFSHWDHAVPSLRHSWGRQSPRGNLDGFELDAPGLDEEPTLSTGDHGPFKAGLLEQAADTGCGLFPCLDAVGRV
jgi:hypothetical protein